MLEVGRHRFCVGRGMLDSCRVWILITPPLAKSATPGSQGSVPATVCIDPKFEAFCSPLLQKRTRRLGLTSPLLPVRLKDFTSSALSQ
jgi:hypothetical protein